MDRGLCIKGQKVLDLGTGTGVLPRNMYKYGAQWTGTDISPEQIEQAKILAADSGMKINFIAAATEQLDFPKESWHGRVRASRGIGASLNPEELARWDAEHRALLDEIAPEKFDILHYGAITVLQKK